MKDPEGTRLDAWLAHAGIGSRRQVRILIGRGHVRLAGEVCRDASIRVGGRSVEVDGNEVAEPISVLHLVLHKPVGYACTHDEREAPIVDDLLPSEFRLAGLHVAGRLDRETSGLVVLTTDGELNHRLTHPRRKLEKRYRIGYRGQLDANATERCAEGLKLVGDERLTLPAMLHIVQPGRAVMLLEEGRTHQVRRMIEALGGWVIELHRDRIGGYDLPRDLPEGECRRLTPEDLERLFTVSDSSL